MRRMRPAVLSLVVAAGPFLGALVGCGKEEVPDDAVAKVGETVVTRADYDKWYRFAEQSPFLKGKAQVKRETMEMLIETEWVLQEAAARDISVSGGEVEREAEKQRGGFPSDEAYRRFLKDASLTEDDLLYRVKVDRLRVKLEKAIATKQSREFPDREIEAYYEGHQELFSRPESRDLTFVLTKTEAKAEDAKQALEDGEAWKPVVRKYSIDPEDYTARAVRGPKLAEGREALERAVYRSRKGEVNGPVKTQLGWYVFEVTKVTPAAKQSLADAEETITPILRRRRAAAAVEQLYQGYRKDTVCADDFKVPECSNGPKRKSS
jgi:foldase protein PrsA